MNVLSCFDGISCGQVALNRANVNYDDYYASEICKSAITVTRSNFPNTIQLGDITKVHWVDDHFELQKMQSDSWIEVPKAASSKWLLMGGSPCQDISQLQHNAKGLLGNKSSMFYHYHRLYKTLKPDNFLLEMVVGHKQSINEISNLMGCEPFKINSALFSAQNRNRYYWTNIKFDKNISDKGIVLADILEENADEKHFLTPGRLKWLLSESGKKSINKKYTALDPIKANCLTRRGEKSWNCNYVTDRGRIRKLTQYELETLQTLPIGYTSSLPYVKAAEAIGNGWTIDVIAHILSGLKFI